MLVVSNLVFIVSINICKLMYGERKKTYKVPLGTAVTCEWLRSTNFARLKSTIINLRFTSSKIVSALMS